MKKEVQRNSAKTFRLAAKYAPLVLCPKNAIEEAFYEGTEMQGHFLTTDKKECAFQLQTVWDNSDGRYDNEMDAVCQENWNMPFRSMRSVWFSRLGKISDIWYLIKLFYD